MTPKTEAQESRFDLFKWLAVVALVVVGVVGNQYYSAAPNSVPRTRTSCSGCCCRLRCLADREG